MFRHCSLEAGTARGKTPAAGGTPEQFGSLIKKDIDMWRRVVQKAGVKPE